VEGMTQIVNVIIFIVVIQFSCSESIVA